MLKGIWGDKVRCFGGRIFHVKKFFEKRKKKERKVLAKNGLSKFYSIKKKLFPLNLFLAEFCIRHKSAFLVLKKKIVLLIF
jgi:hypothetical protein